MASQIRPRDGAPDTLDNSSLDNRKREQRRRAHAAWLLMAGLPLALTLPGCTVGPDPSHPLSAASLHLPGDFHAPSGDAADPLQLATWWSQFNDSELSSLVERAIKGNNDLATAQARLRAARASLKGSQGALLPSVSTSGSGSRQEIVNGGGFAGTSFQAGLDASWEADIFGGLKRTAQAAFYTYENSEASLANVQSSLVAEVALDYLNARQAQQRLKVARDNLSLQDNTLQIVRWRVQAGLVSDLDLQQAISQRANTAASIPSLEQNYEQYSNALSVLLGEAPGSLSDELAQGDAIPLGPDDVEAGLPAELLNRRPDVIAAEKTLAGQVANIGVAEAQLYPALRLSGSLTSSRTNLGNLGTNILGGLVGSISAPIFQGGQLRARVEQAQANADAALSTYRGTVLTAISDVENALVTIDRTKARETQLATAEAAARETVRLADARYESGLIDFQTLLTAQQSLLSAQDSRTVARAARASATVQLYKALGGGWAASSFAQTGSK